MNLNIVFCNFCSGQDLVLLISCKLLMRRVEMVSQIILPPDSEGAKFAMKNRSEIDVIFTIIIKQ